MKIYVPTLGREHSDTLMQIPDNMVQYVKVVYNHDVTWTYPEFEPIICPSWVKGIGMTRQYICDIADGPVLMVDDDLTFFRRREDDPTKFRDWQGDELLQAFETMWRMLDDFAHVGMATREGGNRIVDDYCFNTRLLRVLGYRSDIMKRESVRFDRMKVMEDFDVALQLLTKGYDSCQLNWMVHNQPMSNAAGGCSTYRTIEVQAEAAEALAAKYPQFVTTVRKQTKTAWNGEERTDVRIAWKKARQSAGRTAVLDTGTKQSLEQ